MFTLWRLLRVPALGVVASAVLMPSANASIVGVTVRDMIDFGTLEPVKGVSTLTRHESWVEAFVSTSGLESMAPYTMWWAVFNDPEGCAIPGGCGLSDDDFVEGGPSNTSVLWANGWVSDMNGFATFSASLAEGDAPGEVLFGPGLVDAVGAEIHLVLRVHFHDDGSDILPGEFADAVSSFLGGCPEDIGCFDHQFSVHEAIIPIPAALWLFGSGLGLLGWMRRKAA